MSNPSWSNVPTAWLLGIYGEFMYVSNFNDGTISQINIFNGSIVDATWATTGLPGAYGLVIDSTGTYMYVANANGTISQINMSDGLVVDASWASGLFEPGGLVIDSTGTYMYVSNFSNETISQIDMSDGSIVSASWASGLFGPSGLVIDSTGTYMYVANYNNGTVSQITMSDGLVVDASWATTGLNGVQYLVIDTTGTCMYTTNEDFNKITQILMTDGSIFNDNYISGTDGPGDLTIYNNYIYVANYNNGNIGKYDLITPCFNKGTKILCLNKMNEEEYIAIEDLKTGNLVKSYLHGYRKIDSIGSNKMINNPDHFNLSMYKMAKTDTNGLTEDLIVTGGHSILVDDLGEYYAENEIRFKRPIPKIDDKFFLLCSLSKDFIQLTDKDEYTYYHLCLENNGNNDERFGIWANGILTETISKNQFTEIEHILHF